MTIKNGFANRLLIRASAGTGKTFQLSSRYLRLLVDGVSPDQILATTFTRKAAGEILDRVVSRLAQAATCDETSEKLAEELCIESLDKTGWTGALERMIGQVHLINIETLDSYFATLARVFCLELNLPPDWTIAEDTVNQRTQQEAIRFVLARDDIEDLIALLAKGAAKLSIWQLVAGAISDLYELFLASSKEAWHQFPKNAKLKDAELKKLFEDCLSIELPSRTRTAMESDIKKGRDGDWESVLNTGLFPKYMDGSCAYYKKPFPEELLQCFKKLKKHIAAVLVDFVAKQTHSSYQLLEHYDQANTALKSMSGQLGFDDVTQRLFGFVRNDIEYSGVEDDALHYRLDKRITHLLLDEFQDTAPSQWQVLQPVIHGISSSNDSSFFCVGDTKQAIYGWRGGEARLFDAVEAKIKDVVHDSLAKSYRSSKVIMDFANTVFQGLPRQGVWSGYHAAINSWVDQYPNHTTTKELPGFVEVEYAVDKETLLMEAAQKAAQLHRQSPHTSIGILVRKNDRIAPIINALNHMGIHASEEGGNALTDSPAVLTILSAMRFADHPSDTAACFHALSSPLLEVLDVKPDKAIATIQSAKERAKLAANVRQDLSDKGYCEVVESWAKRLAANTTKREVIRLQQLVEFALHYDSKATSRPSDFVAAVELHKREDPSSARIRVMTIHKAKGLEFDSVIAPDLDVNMVGQTPAVVYDHKDVSEPIDLVTRYASSKIRELMPERFQNAFEHHQTRVIHESMCALYVAITRAVHSCHIIVDPKTKADYKQVSALVLMALNMDPVTNKYVEFGDPNWWQKIDESQPHEPAVTIEDAIDRPVIRFAKSRDSSRNLATDSPSNLEGSDFVTLGGLFRTVDKQLALDRGTLIHAGFEQIEWLDQTTVNKDEIFTALSDVIVGYDVDSFVAEFLMMLNQPNAQRLLKHGEALVRFNDLVPNLKPADLQLSVSNEHPIAVVVDDILLSGYIDRLVIATQPGKPVAAEIIDFKTDRLTGLNDREAQKRIEHYRPQLNAYRQAIAKSLRISPDNISATLLFVDQDKMVSV